MATGKGAGDLAQTIHDAAIDGDLDRVQLLADQADVQLTDESEDGAQPIHHAAGNGHLELAQWLAQQPGVSLTAADNDETQPIHYAADAGQLEMVQWLAQQPGVSLTTETDSGWQPIDCAADNGHLEIAQWLAQQPGVSFARPGMLDQSGLRFAWYSMVEPMHTAAWDGDLRGCRGLRSSLARRSQPKIRLPASPSTKPPCAATSS
jgi:hypothetical protein